MIEINLIPDVKQELIHAERVRTTVISIAIILAIASAALVVVLALYVFAGQTFRDSLVNKDIKSRHSKLASIQDLPNTLTIQNQLTHLSSMHAEKHIDSRAFDVLSSIIPPAPNNVSVSKLIVNNEENTITLEAQAPSGYAALEVFKKTIAATKFYSVPEGETEGESVALASDISESEVSYGEDESGAKTLRFTVSFTYPEQLFARSSSQSTLIAPSRTNATDSYVGLPKSLFSTKAQDIKENK